MQTRALLVDAFTTEPLAGNAAGVVPDAAGLTDAQMRAVARELGASETAFVLPSDSAALGLRYFTPEQEVDACGHATVATLAQRHADGALDAGEFTVETAGGDLAAGVEADGTAWVDYGWPGVVQVDLERASVADALGIDDSHVLTELPLQVATAGLPWLLAPVDFLSSLLDADPDPGAVADLCAAVDATGLYAYTFDALGSDATLHGRAFAPGVGVEEDPVTGTASAAVGAALRVAGALDEWPAELRLEQGHAVERPGVVEVDVDESVRVGGRAVAALDGDLTVPDADDDEEILEV